MLEGWEWILIGGFGALIVVAVTIAICVSAVSKPKTIVYQGYPPERYAWQPTSKICSQCGFEASDNAKFCPQCGKQLI